VALGTGVVVLVGGAIAARQAWIFIHRDLAPLIEQNLSQTVNRPVKLGPVEGVSLISLKFGPSTLPPTATDKDQASVQSVEAQFNLLQVLLTRTLRLNLTLVRPTLYIDQDKDGTWIKTRLQTQEKEGFIKTELNQVRIQDAHLTLAPAPRLTAASGEPPGFDNPGRHIRVIFEKINGDAIFRDRNRVIDFDTAGVSKTGGDFRLRGEANTTTQAVNVVVQGQGLLASDIGSLLPLPIGLLQGRVGANLEVRYRPQQPLAFNGVANFRDLVAVITNVPNRFSRANGQLRFKDQLITLEDGRAYYGQIPARASGTIDIQKGYNLTAQVRSVDVNTILKTFKLTLPVAASGRLNANLRLTGALNQPLITGAATNASGLRVDRVDVADINARFRVTPKFLAFDRIDVTPTAGGQVFGNGRFTFGGQGNLAFAFRATDLPGDAIARPYGFTATNITLGRLAADVSVVGPVKGFQAVVRWRAPSATYPGQGTLVITQNVIRLDNAALQVAGGTVTARAIATQGRWQALVSLAGIRLSQFSQQLRGLFSGDLRLSGSLAALNPQGVRAEGQVRFSQGIAIINQPTTASIAWTGDRLVVRQATAPGFNANGYILAQLQGPGAPAITALNLNVNLRNYQVAALPIPLPQQVRLRGQADFSGQVTGTATAPNVVGRLQLNDLAANNLAFEPVLRGTFRYAGGQGLNLNVAGQQDQLQIALNGTNRPTSFLVRQGDILAQGRGQGDRLLATLQNFPLEALNINPVPQLGIGTVGGRVDGTFDINLATLTNPRVVGNVAIARPSLGYLAGDTLAAQFSYANGTAILRTAELRRAESRYLISGRFTVTPAVDFQGQITADQGRIQDIISALQWFDFQDIGRGVAAPTYASAASVRTNQINTIGYTLLNQLRRYSEINALLDQAEARRRQTLQLPSLADLQGNFSGTANFAGSPQAGITADFNFQGQNWTWDAYGVNQVVVEGNLKSGVLTLLPLRLQGLTYAKLPQQRPNAFVAFSGQVGGPNQSGQLQVQNLPVEALRDLFRVPLNLTGALNLTATLTGRQQNPEVVGEINLVDATLNGAPVESARAFFGYNNARLDFDSTFAIASSEPTTTERTSTTATRVCGDSTSLATNTGPEPLRVCGSIPYKFAFLDPQLNPGNQINLEVSVRNEGLSLLNLVTRRQLLWEGGQGQAQLNIGGTLSQPIVNGTVALRDAQFSAVALPEPLTNVSADIQFNRDLIQVQNFQGQFRQGQVTAVGAIPIFDPGALPDNGTIANATNPLTINLNQLALNLKGLYNGGINGQVLLTGAALAPRLGGDITLANGRISLPETSQAASAPQAPPTEDAGGLAFTPVRLNNLTLNLGTNLLIARAPIFSFIPRGSLVINGPLSDLRPNGTIRLVRGQVNLFTTQFNLARGENTAIFTPERRLDPTLNVRLIASVVEVTRSTVQTATPFSSSEIADVRASQLGAFQTVRIQASVRGPASEIFDNLELTSSPTRSQGEIVALLGGGFVDTQGRADSTLAIANLAGSALLTNIQNLIGNTLGLSEFRLFPTTIPNAQNRTSSLGLAAELGVDISRNLSASVLQILTDNVPTQFGLRYRLSDQLLFRGSSDFSGDNRLVLEYETRF
jgi:translocation and assembly module TamB